MRPVFTEVCAVPVGVAELVPVEVISPGCGTAVLSTKSTLTFWYRYRAGLQSNDWPNAGAFCPCAGSVMTPPFEAAGMDPQKPDSGWMRMLTKSPGTITPATPFVWSTEIVMPTHPTGLPVVLPPVPGAAQSFGTRPA